MDPDRATREIESVLAWYNDQRVRVYGGSLRGRRIAHMIGVAATAVAILGAIAIFGFNEGVIGPLIFQLMIVYGIWRVIYEKAIRPTKELESKVRRLLQPLMLDFVDKLVDPEAQAAFQPYKLLPRATVGYFDTWDVKVIVAGRHKGVPFQICRAKLSSDGGDGPSQTMFVGTILVVQLNEPLDGTLVLAHEHDLSRSFAKWITFKALEITLPNPACKVHSSNPQALAPALLTRLCDELDRLYQNEARLGVPPRIAVNRGWGFVLVPDEAGLRFDLPDISVPMDLERDVRTVSANVRLLLSGVQRLCDIAIAA